MPLSTARLHKGKPQIVRFDNALEQMAYAFHCRQILFTDKPSAFIWSIPPYAHLPGFCSANPRSARAASADALGSASYSRGPAEQQRRKPRSLMRKDGWNL